VKGEGNGVVITGGSGMSCLVGRDFIHSVDPGGDANATEDFNPLWIHEFRRTNAYDVWERTTDPLLFDIVEPR
jgi:hypothetical protein